MCGRGELVRVLVGLREVLRVREVTSAKSPARLSDMSNGHDSRVRIGAKCKCQLELWLRQT